MKHQKELFVTNNWKHFYGQYCLISETALDPLVLRIRVVSRWRRIWSNGGMILPRELSSTRRRFSPTATLSTKDFTWSSPTANIFTTYLTWSGPRWNAGLRGEGGRGYWPLQLRHTHKTTFIFSRVLPSAICTEEETFVRVAMDLWTTVDSSDPK